MADEKITKFISEINVISELLAEKIIKLKDKALSDVYIDELTETLKDLNKISNDTNIELDQDDLTKIRGAIDSKIQEKNANLSAPDKKKIMEKVDEIITKMKNEVTPKGGKGKTRKQRKHKKHRKQRKSKKHI